MKAPYLALLPLLLVTACAGPKHARTVAGPVPSPGADVVRVPPPGADAGRYALCAGTFTLDGPTPPISRPAIFKIDTATGQVWRYNAVNVPILSSNPAPGQMIIAEGWVELPSSFRDGLHATLGQSKRINSQ